MKTEILINSTDYDKRLAMLEDDKLVELQVARPDTERMVGDIYKAKIKTVLPGMQAEAADTFFRLISDGDDIDADDLDSTDEDGDETDATADEVDE